LERGINRAPRNETLRLLAAARQLSAEARARLEAALRCATCAGALAAPERGAFADSTYRPLAGRAHDRSRLAQQLARGRTPAAATGGRAGQRQPAAPAADGAACLRSWRPSSTCCRWPPEEATLLLTTLLAGSASAQRGV